MLEQLEEAERLLSALQGARADIAIETGTGKAQALPVATIAGATLRGGRVVLVLADGKEVTARSSETLVSLAQHLKPFPQFVRTHNGWMANLDQVDTITRVGASEYQLGMRGGATVPLLQGLQAVMDYFGLKSLDHVIPWNERLAIILKENLRDFEKDLRLTPNEDLQKLFSDGTGQLVITQLIGNIVWQAYNWIRDGKLGPVDGNLRSFWYSHIKPVLGRMLPAVNEGHYGAMSGVFAKYVGDYHLFRYADFGFVEDGDSPRQIGSKCPHVVVFAEKKGHWRTLQKIAEQAGCTVISLGGQPSLMTSEYFAADLAKATSLNQTIHLITDVDYDPSGIIIAESFRDQLRQMGVTQTTMRHLVVPANFTAEEVKYFKYPVANESPSDKTKVKQWLNPDKRRFPEREPGGIPDDQGVRQPMGLESDAIPRDRLMALAVAEVQKLTAPPGADRLVRPSIKGFPYL